MKYLCPLGALLLAACATPAAPASPAAEAAAPVLAACDPGAARDVTMYGSPTGPPSATVMVLAAAPDNRVMGVFCQPDFLEGEYSLRGDTLAFAGVTADGRRSAAIPDASWRGGSKARPCRTAAISS